MVKLLLFFVCSLVLSVRSNCSRIVIRDGETLATAAGIFESGFFSPADASNRYLGIWYKNITPRAVVWVANKRIPLADASGTLNLTRRGVLILLNSRNNTVWSSENASGTGRDSIPQIMDSGNLVVRERNDSNPDNYIWQSFDHPCDTLLPGMKLGTNFSTGLQKYLSPWKSPENPAPGSFSLLLDTHGYPQLVAKIGSETVYRAASWNGFTFSGTPCCPCRNSATGRLNCKAQPWNLETRFDVEDDMLERDGLMLVIVIWDDQAFRGKKTSVEARFRVKDLLERSRGNKEVAEVLTGGPGGGGTMYFGFKFGPRVTRRTGDEVHTYASESYPGVRVAPSAPYMEYLYEANTDEEKLISSSDILAPCLVSDLNVMQL